jgi:hypothetical protein
MTLFADDTRLLIESGLFDERWYVARYPDVARSGLSAADHYVRIGQQLGRKRNADEAAAAGTLPMPEATKPAGPADAGVAHSAGSNSHAATYRQYQQKIFTKLAALGDHVPRPVAIEVDTDYTGPASATAFDTFATKRAREDSAKQIARMLRFGIAAINPRPGVSATRQDNGDFIRYRSIAAQNQGIDRVPGSMLIHIHAFYPDVLEEMLDRFEGDAINARFVITTTTKKTLEAIEMIVEERGLTACQCLLIDNKGRDIGPMLDHVVDLAADGETICHVHTKKSPDVGGSYGEKWRQSLYGALLTQTAIDAFDDPKLGLLFPDSSRCVGWGKNHAFCETIAGTIGVALPPHPGPIPVGSMFMVRTEVARAMRDATGGVTWPREPVAYDGTVLHAIERMWPIVCDHAGFEWAAIHMPIRDGVSGAPLETGAKTSRST